MANLSQTAANVVASSGAATRSGVSGGTVTAGMPLYQDAADASKLKPADASAQATGAVIGIALNGASDGQPVDYVFRDDDFDPGGTCVLGQTYVVSATAGAIALEADILTGEYLSPVGVGNASGNLTFDLTNATYWHGAAHA